MQFGLLFKKTSTAKKADSNGNPDIEYLDETSDEKLKIKSKAINVPVDHLKKNLDKILQSIDYLSKEEFGTVYAGGWMRDKMLEVKGTAPEKWDNNRRKSAIKSEILKVEPYKKYNCKTEQVEEIIGHRTVFSVSSELQEKVEKSGLNLDRVLVKEMKKVMKEFETEFHKGQRIGYAWGIHHDTDNRHIHLYLSHRTDKGKYVGLSNPLKNKKPGKYTQKDKIGFLKERLALAELRIRKAADKAITNENTVKVEDIKIKPESCREKKVESKAKSKAPFIFKSMDENVLERQEKKLAARQKEIAASKEHLKGLYAEYNLRKNLIASGYDDVKEMNALVGGKYKELKAVKAVIPSKMLHKLGYCSQSGPLRLFSKLVGAIQHAENQAKRDEIFAQINKSQEYKQKVVKQVERLKEERNRFLDEVKKVREENRKKQQTFYRQLREYRNNLDRYNLAVFMNSVASSQLKREYFSVLRELKEKKNAGIDCSKEKEYLRQLNLFVKRQAEQESSEVVYAKSQATDQRAAVLEPQQKQAAKPKRRNRLAEAEEQLKAEQRQKKHAEKPKKRNRLAEAEEQLKAEHRQQKHATIPKKRSRLAEAEEQLKAEHRQQQKYRLPRASDNKSNDKGMKR